MKKLAISDKDVIRFNVLDLPHQSSISGTLKPNRKLIIAVDFDGTIVEHKFPAIGELLPGAKETLNHWNSLGYDVIIWTCRNQSEPHHPEWTEAHIGAVKDFLDKNEIKYTTINSDSPNISFWLQARKVYADVYIDDRNLGGFPGWYTARAMVSMLQK